jgi:hypothetical protein
MKKLLILSIMLVSAGVASAMVHGSDYTKKDGIPCRSGFVHWGNQCVIITG